MPRAHRGSTVPGVAVVDASMCICQWKLRCLRPLLRPLTGPQSLETHPLSLSMLRSHSTTSAGAHLPLRPRAGRRPAPAPQVQACPGRTCRDNCLDKCLVFRWGHVEDKSRQMPPRARYDTTQHGAKRKLPSTTRDVAGTGDFLCHLRRFDSTHGRLPACIARILESRIAS